MNFFYIKHNQISQQTYFLQLKHEMLTGLYFSDIGLHVRQCADLVVVGVVGMGCGCSRCCSCVASSSNCCGTLGGSGETSASGRRPGVFLRTHIHIGK